MKISKVHVDGFGVWTDLTLDALSPEVTVFFGPNEAGKTTLMQLVRAVLYGYSPERRQRYLPPVFGGRPGGSLTIEAGRGLVEIDRRADRSDSSGLGKVSVIAPDGSSQGQHLLNMMLAGVDETIFTNVFAVGLREIQELGTLTGTQAASHLFALTAGMDRVSLLDVMRDLILQRNEIVTHDGEGMLADLIARRQKISSQVHQYRAATAQWSELVGQQLAIERQTTDVEAEVADLEHRLAVLELADRIRARWLENNEVAGEIESLEPLPELPEGALARYEELTAQITAQQTLCDDLKLQWTALRDEARGLPINEGIRRNCCRIEALGEQEPWLLSIREHIDWLQGEIASVETELVTERDDLGLVGVIEWDELPQLRQRAEEDLREPAARVKLAQEAVEKSREEVAARRQAAKSVVEKFDTALTELGEEDLTTALEKAGDHVTKLRRRLQLDERMEGLRRHRKELEDEGDDLAEDQLLSFGAMAFIGLMFVGGVVAILTAFTHYYFGLTETAAWIVGAAGASSMLASLILKAALERIAASRMDDCDEELDRVLRQMKKAKKEIEQLDAELPHGSGPLAAQVHQAEQQLARLEELVPLDADRAEASEHDETAQAKARQAAADLKDARNAWRESLVAAGLPGEMTAEQIQRIVSRCDYLVDLQERLHSRREELEKRNAELVSLTGRINRLSDDVGVKLRSREPQELLQAVVSEHSSQQELLKQHDALRKQAKELKSQYQEQARELRKLQHACRNVLREANVANEEVLRELAATIERYEELVARREQLESEITAIIGDVSLDEIEAELRNSDKAFLVQRFDALSSQLGQAEIRQKELYRQRGRLGEQVKALEADNRLPQAEMELGCINEEIDDAVKQWRTLAATSVILESVRHIYETQRQPATLSDASKYLGKMTDNRYCRVWTPLDEDTLLVDDAHGNSLRIEVLSAGTREQVFLAIRLALVAMYARRGAALPLVLDDVLVNCDAVRAKAAAQVLCDFAADGHQLLIFTCHEHIMRIFQMLHADVRKLPVRSELGAAELADLEEPPPPVIEHQPEEAIDEDMFADLLDSFVDEEPEEEEPELFADVEPEDEDFELPEEEPVVEAEPEPIEPMPVPVPRGEDEWLEDLPPGPADEEPFAALLQHAGARRSHWSPSDEHDWDED